MKTLISVVVFISTVFIGNVYADAQGPGADDFYKDIQSYRKHCNQNCSTPFRQQPVYDQQQPGHPPLSSDVKKNLKNIAEIQAQIWGDTILEGDYYADGKTRLDKVVLIFKTDKFVGYKVFYSERAWFVGECEFDGLDETTLHECSEGRIHESTFVSPDFKTYFRNEDDYADFEG